MESNRQDAEVSLRTIAMPGEINANGDIFGGWILSQMDLAGGNYAFFAACGKVATRAMTDVQFYKPVKAGDEVSCYCSTARQGRTSISVQVDVWVRRRQLELEERVADGLLTFVAIDANGRPRLIQQSANALDSRLC